MIRLASRLLAGVATVAFGIVAYTVTGGTPALAQTPNFGSPPSGEIPILYNDQHVYTKPDRLKRGRVLAALVRGNTVLIPLRSMFEQMGATVSYDPSTKTVDVSKPGADVQVTVGKPEVIINGESRPLDVPPEIYRGVVVVPVRVISEGMGAYVQWVPDRRLVVVRYLPPPTPPPAPPPTPAPTEAPTAAPPPPPPPPTPPPPPRPRMQAFIVGDAIFDPQVYNEFSPGNTGDIMPGGRAGIEFPVGKLGLLLEGSSEQYRYPHDSGSFPANSTCTTGSALGTEGCVTTIGQTGQTFVPSFELIDRQYDAKVGVGVFGPHIYAVGAYTWQSENDGYPVLKGLGFGLEKEPDFNSVISIYASLLYFPQIQGLYTAPVTAYQYQLEYRVFKYNAGLDLNIPHTPFFLEGGVMGDAGSNKMNAPANYTHRAVYGGLGLHF